MGTARARARERAVFDQKVYHFLDFTLTLPGRFGAAKNTLHQNEKVFGEL